jgi:predicted regulator of Ras-like GTPase activity (Roadblock/LC7/MglB family)
VSTIPVYREDLLVEALRELTEALEGIRGAVIVSVEGFVVAAYPGGGSAPGAPDSPQVAAMAATLFALGEQTLLRLAQGESRRLLIEGDTGAMIVYPIDEQAILAAMVRRETKMGLALHTVERWAGRLANILNGTA